LRLQFLGSAGQRGLRLNQCHAVFLQRRKTRGPERQGSQLDDLANSIRTRSPGVVPSSWATRRVSRSNLGSILTRNSSVVGALMYQWCDRPAAFQVLFQARSSLYGRWEMTAAFPNGLPWSLVTCISFRFNYSQEERSFLDELIRAQALCLNS
jgi:hypothetical protein